VSNRTPEGTTNILELLGQARVERMGLWQRVRLAVLRMTLFRGGKRVFSAPVDVGQPRSPTPPGEFYARNVLSRYRSATCGPIAFGTSARSPTLTDWPAGGYVGIHGTDQPNLVPGRISHRCIRLGNADILRLAALMPVGTPITVR
jgi:lipoprotein-anchoring transpeptidase ErfK/SrfK